MEDLAERIRRGDRSAEETLVDHFYGRVYAMALARTRDRETSLDLAQEIIVAVLCALREGRLRNPTALSAYVCTTARNRISYFYRQRARRPTGSPRVIESSLPDPEQTAEHAERARLAQRAIEHLNVGERQILRLTMVEGLKAGEIAVRLALKPEAVRKRKSRALNKARRFLHKKRSRNHP